MNAFTQVVRRSLHHVVPSIVAFVLVVVVGEHEQLSVPSTSLRVRERAKIGSGDWARGDNTFDVRSGGVVSCENTTGPSAPIVSR